MYYFIASTDRTADVIDNTLNIDDNIRESPNALSITLKGDQPSQWDEIRAFDGFPIVEAGADYVVLDMEYRANMNGLFRVGDEFYVALNEADEEYGVIAELIDDAYLLRVKMTDPFQNIPSVGSKAGKLRFAGNVIDLGDENLTLLKNVQHSITAIDYTRLFDKELINDTFSERDSRYIVNSFCNTFINYNAEIDAMDYLTNGDIQAKWLEGGDGNNPTVDLLDYREGVSSGVFSWTFNTGVATFEDTIFANDIAVFMGTQSGQPTKGVKGFWYKTEDYTVVTNIIVRIGSSNANYIEFVIEPTSNGWVFVDLKAADGAMTGNPDWSAMDYLHITINQTASSSIKFDGFRILENQFFRHYPFVEISPVFNDFRINRVKPTEVMQRLADELAWYWYIDYKRYIHLFPKGENSAPFDIDEESDNFDGLRITYDSSRLVNRQVVMGAEETSESVYSEVKEGDAVQREWITKNNFKNLYVGVDDGTITDLMEVGTTTTTVVATGHGLLVGDYIVNRTQSNAVRRVNSVLNANSFTIDEVIGQASGNTFSKFLAMNVGVEGLNSDTGNNYMSNFEEKSIRAAENEPTLQPGHFVLFRYNEVIPILVQRTEGISVQNMKSVLGHTNGIFDGQPIIDRTIKTRPEANNLAKAHLQKYSNLIISAEFSTYIDGLKAGQVIHIKDTTSSERNIDQDFLIQSVRITEVAWGVYNFKVMASSTLYGMLELLIQLLRQQRKIDVDQDAVINNIEDVPEVIYVTDSVTVDVPVDGEDIHTESIAVDDEVTIKVFEPPYKWGLDPDMGYWNLAQWG